MESVESVLLPQIWLTSLVNLSTVADVAYYLTQRAWKYKESTSVMYNGTLLEVAYSNIDPSLASARAVTFWWERALFERNNRVNR